MMRSTTRLLLFAGFVIAAASISHAQSFTCTPPAQNQIVCENSKPGNPASEWDISGNGNSTIQGFATDISVNQGETIRFKVKTSAAYRIDIYRIGYYGGLGARKIATVTPTARTQPACLTQSATGLIDCGNWLESASWTVPPDATSGVYIAKPTRLDNGGASHIIFVVRADSSNSDLLYQTSDTTWNAYNAYGGNSLYTGSPAGRAYKVSYNRPLNIRGAGGGPSSSNFFSAEYPMVRFLEQNGYDVTYFTGIDTDRNATKILNHKVFLSVGHDEYWSNGQRASVEAARNAGVNLAFFSGNEMFWKTRWENSISSPATSYRTLVCYKETAANQVIDPLDPPTWTGTWRDPRFSPPGDGGRPENAVTGTLFMVNGPRSDAISVPSTFSRMRIWRNTSIEGLAPGAVQTFPVGVLGYEWDEDIDNGFRPAGSFPVSSTTIDLPGLHLLDYGTTYGPGLATHSLVMYRAASGALVFGAGSVQWAWGLDGTHDNGVVPTEIAMQQATVNLFADMGAQPATLKSSLVPAFASTDFSVPTSTITSPAAGTNVPSTNPITVRGTAADSGGGVVAAVEVSTDGGTTWRRAQGRETWTYDWTPGPVGTANLKSRAVDDSGNLGSGGVGVTVNVIPDTVPPIISSVTVSTVTTTFAIVTWTTNEPSDSQADFGLTTTYGSSSGLDSALVTSHSMVLNGLSANTLYHYRVKSRDVSGNLAVSGDFTFTASATTSTTRVTFDDLVNPNRGLSGQYPTGIIDWGATNWWLSAPWLKFTTNSVSFSSAGGFQSSFTFLTRLRLVALDAFNGGGTSATVTFSCPGQANKQVTLASQQLSTLTTDWNDACSPVTIRTSNADSTNFDNLVIDSPPTTPPVISNVQSSSTTCSSTTITWITDKGSDSQVEYGTTTAYGSSTPLNTSLVTSHSVTLTGLTANTLYHYRVKSRDNAGNLVVSSDATFTTGTVNTTQPVVSNVQAVAVTSSSAYVIWNTDVETDSQVEYGTSTPYSNTTPLNSAGVTSHSVLLSGLTANTTYHFRVRSGQPCGGVTFSDDFTFTTTGAAAQSIWSSSVVPAIASQNDPQGVEVGVKFRSDVDGYITGFRFYKGTGNIGTHVGKLWTSTGALLASATFVGETSLGWQQVNLASPVAIAANTTYVASYYAPSGGYAVNQGYFATAGFDSPPLHALRDGVSGANGVFLYGSGGFPTQTFSSSNYWVDVLFVSSGAPPVVPPVISNVLSGGITSSGATVTWTTDKASDSQVEYGTTTAYGSSTTLDTTLVTSHSVPLAGLTASTLYHYRVKSRDSGGNQSVSGDFTFTTATAPVPPPVISNVQSSGIGSGGATITWTTDQASDSQVEYGTTTAYGSSTPLNPALVSSHSVAITGLTGNTLYHYRVLSRNSSGGSATSGDFTFTTLPASTTPPVITAVNVIAISSSSAYVQWNTDVAADSRVNYGLTAAYGSSTPLDSTLVTSHSVLLSGLTANTTYHYQVVSNNGGNPATAGDFIFTTTSNPVLSLWSASTIPAVTSQNDTAAVELGLKFRSDVDGYVTGVRFYKGTANTGVHTGKLYTNAGTLLASVVFANETAGGWQQMNFSVPVAITANTTYVVSYHTTSGGYAVNSDYFLAAGFDNAPLHGLRDLTAPGNGVYLYGAGGFPTQTFAASNYWVDVLFVVK